MFVLKGIVQNLCWLEILGTDGELRVRTRHVALGHVLKIAPRPQCGRIMMIVELHELDIWTLIRSWTDVPGHKRLFAFADQY